MAARPGAEIDTLDVDMSVVEAPVDSIEVYPDRTWHQTDVPGP